MIKEKRNSNLKDKSLSLFSASYASGEDVEENNFLNDSDLESQMDDFKFQDDPNKYSSADDQDEEQRDVDSIKKK